MPFEISPLYCWLFSITESMVQFLCFTEASLGIWRTWINSS